jgi:hypothetical protein
VPYLTRSWNEIRVDQKKTEVKLRSRGLYIAISPQNARTFKAKIFFSLARNLSERETFFSTRERVSLSPKAHFKRVVGYEAIMSNLGTKQHVNYDCGGLLDSDRNWKNHEKYSQIDRFSGSRQMNLKMVIVKKKLVHPPSPAPLREVNQKTIIFECSI